MRYKLCKFCENRARDTPLMGVYIPHFGQIWVKISTPLSLHRWGWNLARSPHPWQISPPSMLRVAPVGRKTSKVHGTSCSLLWIKSTLHIHALYFHWLTTLSKWTTIDNMTFMLQQLHRTQELDGCIVWNAHNTVGLLGEEALLIHIVPVGYAT